MYCNNCGEENPANSKFCSSCGANLKISQQNDVLVGLEVIPENNSKKSRFQRFSRRQTLLIAICIFLTLSLLYALYLATVNRNNSMPAIVQEQTATNSTEGVLAEGSDDYSSGYNEDPGSFVWQRNLDMTGVGSWVERAKADWKEDVGQQYLFVNQIGCLFYVFDENAKDKDLMNRAYQWLSQYAGVHIAGANWLLMDSSYGEKCTGPVTDTFGGYRVN